MGEGRQDQKAAPVKAGTDPGTGKPPGKAPPLPPRALNGAPSPRAPQFAAPVVRPATPGSGISPVAPVAAAPPDRASPDPASPTRPSSDDLLSIPIDTEPPAPVVVQSGATARPPELAGSAPVAVPPAPAAPASDPVSLPPGAPLIAAVEVGQPGASDPPGANDPSAVDFDALHAALGEGSREAAPPGAPPPGAAAAAAKPGRPVAAESMGRSNATYASKDAKAPPVAHVDADLGAPAVIVAQDDAVPPYGPPMTTPMAPPMTPGHPSSGPHAIGAPSSGGMRAAQAHAPAHAPGNTPQAFDPVALGLPPARPGQVALTMRMPERPRRQRTPTVVVRQRGPSTRQKLFVFSGMLLLVSLIGLAIVMWRAPQLFGFGSKAQPTTTKPAASAAPALTTATTALPSASATTALSASSATPSASAAASAKPGLKPKGK